MLVHEGKLVSSILAKAIDDKFGYMHGVQVCKVYPLIQSIWPTHFNAGLADSLSMQVNLSLVAPAGVDSLADMEK